MSENEPVRKHVEAWQYYRLPPAQMAIYKAMIERARLLPTRERKTLLALADRYAYGVRLRLHESYKRALKSFWTRARAIPEGPRAPNKPKRQRNAE